MTDSGLVDGVSIVIPTKNRRSQLGRAIKSVCEQSLQDTEIIVVDDASEPRIIADELPYHRKLRVIREAKPLGPQRARLIGVQAAEMPYVALLDSDDWWHRDKLRRQLQVAVERPDALLSCRVTVSRPNFAKVAPWRVIKAGEKVEDFLYIHRGMLQTSTIFGKKQLIQRILCDTQDSVIHNDTVMCLRAQTLGFPIEQMTEALSYFDDTPRSDRVSYDPGRLEAAELWFCAVSDGWSAEARGGFILTDLVTRCVNTGNRLRAWKMLWTALGTSKTPEIYIKKAAYIVFNGSPLRFTEAFKRFLFRLSKTS